MNQPLFLTRARINPSASAGALVTPSLRDGPVASGHRLLWTLFADQADRARDFLWRDTGEGGYLILSQRQPVDRHNLFDLDPPRPFAPSLVKGQRIGFLLRANATATRKIDGGPQRPDSTKRRRKHDDVVMQALSALPKGPERAAARAQIEQSAGMAWLKGQGERSGFSVEGLSGLSYQTLRIPHKSAPIRLGVLDLEGVVTVEDPEAFLQAVSNGFGRSKAYGFGLMLIRRES